MLAGERVVPVNPPFAGSLDTPSAAGRAEAANMAAREVLTPLPLSSREGGKAILIDSPDRPSSPKRVKKMPPSKSTGKRKAPSADRLASSSTSPASAPRPSSPGSRVHAPRDHTHFGLGAKACDVLGEPMVTWSEEVNRVSISSLLPNWSASSPATNHAYALAFGLYSRESAKAYEDTSPRRLAFEAMRAQFRSLELTHMTARRCAGLVRERDQAEKDGEKANLAADSLEQQLETANRLLASHDGCLSAESADRLRAGKQELEEKCRAQAVQITSLLSNASSLQLAGSARQYSQEEVDDQCREAARRAAETTLAMMREIGSLQEDYQGITAQMLVPQLYPPAEDDTVAAAEEEADEGEEEEYDEFNIDP